ncbi:MAG: AI-2E family transporter [Proteobacteria bacterium]|nr:AI-2E family transporter [Pseudomonadota bacterium]
MIKEKIVFYLAIIAIIIGFLFSISGILLPFVLAAVLAYLLDPLVDKLETKVNRSVISAMIVLLFFLCFLLILVMSVPAMLDGIKELSGLLSNSDQIIKEKLVPFLNSVLPIDINTESVLGMMQTHSQELTKYLTTWLKAIAVSTMRIFDLVSIFLILPIALYYMLKDWDKMIAIIESLFPKNEKSYISEVFGKINKKISGFVRGQLLVGLCLGVIYGIGLSLIGLKLGLLIGFVTGLLSFIPYVGLGLGCVVSFILAFLQFPITDLQPFVLMAGVFALGQLLESVILSPKLVGDALGLHPLWIIFAVLAGGELGGFMGILIALPVSAVISVLITELLTHYKSSKIYRKRSAKINKKKINKKEVKEA